MGDEPPRAAPSTTSLWLDQRRSGPPESPVPPIEPPGDDTDTDVVIAGAGLTGLATALILARSGFRVAVLEARTIASGTTGRSSAKATVLQGTRLQKLQAASGPRAVAAHLESQRVALAWLRDYLDGTAIPWASAPSVTFAASPDERAIVRREFEAAARAGLPVEWREQADLPGPTFGAVVLDDQIRLDPVALADALASDVRELGGRIIESVRVTGARVPGRASGRPITVRTSAGPIRAQHLILATGIPVLDRGLAFAKVEASRSSIVAFTVSGDDARDRGMFLSAGSNPRSVRWDGDHLLVGGEPRGAGRHRPGDDPYARLEQWTVERFPSARRTHAWSAQDYVSGSHIPFVGPLPRGRGRVLLATGYDKWGMTGAIAAALTLAGDLGGPRPGWQRTLRHRITVPRAAARTIALNARAVGWYLGSWAAALAGRSPIPTDQRRESRLPPRVSRRVSESATLLADDGGARLSLVCPHLGAIVRWNGLEGSWDCPAHGSRFDADGALLEGPATRGLTCVPNRPAGRSATRPEVTMS